MKPRSKNASPYKIDGYQRWVQRLIRWAELLKEFDRVSALVSEAARDGIIEGDRVQGIQTSLLEARDEVFNSGVPGCSR